MNTLTFQQLKGASKQSAYNCLQEKDNLKSITVRIQALLEVHFGYRVQGSKLQEMAHPTGFEPVTSASKERHFEMFQFDIERQNRMNIAITASYS